MRQTEEVRLRSLLLAVVGLLLLAPQAIAAEQKQVLVLYSTARETQGAVVGERELPRALVAGLDGRLNYYSEFIDQGRIAVAEYREGFRDFLRLKYSNQSFDLVVALQEPAATFIEEYRDDLFPETPVVFFGYSRVPHLRNSTGLSAGLKLGDTLDVATALQPDLQRVFVISGASDRDKAFENQAKTAFRAYEPRLSFTYLSGLTLEGLKAGVGRLPAHSAVFFLLVYQDGSGERTLPLDYLDQVTAVASAPTYSWVDSAIDHGIVGGALLNQTRGMDAVARLALRILRGEQADDIPASTLDMTERQVDWRQLRRWNISEARLPPGSVLRFKAPTLWDEYRVYILGAVGLIAAQAALIAGLLVQASRRRQAEKRLVLSQARLQASYAQLSDAGGRLLEVQELERSRIARELHDDLGQQMAVLAIDLRAVEDGPRDGPGRADRLREAQNRLQTVAKTVHNLSHRLHPERLRLLGTVAAVEGLVREQSHPGVSVAFRHEKVPEKVDERISICAYRVVQEALQNALKHSGARSIAIELRGDSGTLHLSIVDDGRGFDVEQLFGKGLGLISMKERLEIAGGTLTIRSAPGSGAAIRARLPLSQPNVDQTVDRTSATVVRFDRRREQEAV